MYRSMLLVVLFASLPLLAQGEWSGSVSLEGLGFAEQGSEAIQERQAFSLSISPEYYKEWREGDMSLTFRPFYRYDETDDERTHFDIRELTWQMVANRWELRLGVRKEFWGVTESVHLVDIINQTDLVENPDGEQKLGQAMANFAWISDYGTFDMFLLPGFRERSFPGEQGRLRSSPRVLKDAARYESEDKEQHVDWAVRYSHSLGIWDLALSHFRGTSRDPLFVAQYSGDQGHFDLAPYYAQIQQTGFELQAAIGGWLLKTEAIYRDGSEAYSSVVSGFEYTIGNVGGSGLDVGLLGEYIYDERGEEASTPYARDVFVGSRLALNDVAATEILIGAVVDTQGGGTFFNLEAERRIANGWKLALENRIFSGTSDGDPLHPLRDEDHARLVLKRYF